MTKLMLSILAGLTIAGTGASVAAADSNCQDFEIHVHNEFEVGGDAKDIRVVDFSYWDDEDSRWRNETTSNSVIGVGDDDLWEKNLSYVGGETGVVIRVFFQVFDGGWGPTIHRDSNAFRCIDGDHLDIDVD